MKKSDVPGLKWRRRADGTRAAIWNAPPRAVAAGFAPKSLDMSSCPPGELPSRCTRLWAEALAFAAHGERDRLAFDGTLGSVLRIYELRLKASTQREYAIYLGKLSRHYGKAPDHVSEWPRHPSLVF
jgi:hypothetical protein